MNVLTENCQTELFNVYYLHTGTANCQWHSEMGKYKMNSLPLKRTAIKDEVFIALRPSRFTFPYRFNQPSV
jgi:hypothetical protein